eukprot:212493-Pleurochrysis_carterae.AAC.6
MAFRRLHKPQPEARRGLQCNGQYVELVGKAQSEARQVMRKHAPLQRASAREKWIGRRTSKPKSSKHL